MTIVILLTENKHYICYIKAIKTYIILGFITVFTVVLVFPTLIIVDFYVNQDTIIAKKCINKDKPELHCDGKCYLKKELNTQKQITTDQENTELKTFIFTPIFIQNMRSIQIDRIFASTIDFNHYYKISYSFLFSTQLLNPPQG